MRAPEVLLSEIASTIADIVIRTEMWGTPYEAETALLSYLTVAVSLEHDVSLTRSSEMVRRETVSRCSGNPPGVRAHLCEGHDKGGAYDAFRERADAICSELLKSYRDLKREM